MNSSGTPAEGNELTDDLFDFLDSSPTSSFAVYAAAGRLEAAGFTRLDEKDGWDLKPGTRFFVVRSSSSVIAGITGREPPRLSGFRIAGAHTDSPGFRVKPCPERKTENIGTLSVEIYGSPIIATWFDRDLSLAGSLALREGNAITRRPFMTRDPLFRMASPAVHIDREINKEGFRVDRESGTPVIYSASGATFDDVLSRVCAMASVDREKVAGWSLELWDPQPATRGGLDGDMIFSGRLDNLAMCHAAVRALIKAGPGRTTSLVALFNSEEVGSATLNGAGSNFLETVTERLAGDRESYFRSIPLSVQVSVDGAHGLHPNYAGKHDPTCRPLVNGGPVIKVNAMERYTSSDVTSAYFASCAADCGVGVQYFVSRNDMPCGSTIGPLTSTRTGMRSVDAGNPMLSMHSVREMSGLSDHSDMTAVLARHLGGEMEIDD
ncbi:MAG: hypothetical protein AVO35_04190 [Candidatus Aegiribacteria sp. MLS_C]|nr:MAG: hypothetical protein AVO35_04190 [Candidatus Aegiribacteria sp. MLS_C]